MPKRRYVNSKKYLERIYAQQRRIDDRIADLWAEAVDLADRRALLEDRAEVLVAYDWQSRNGFPLLSGVVS